MKNKFIAFFIILGLIMIFFIYIFSQENKKLKNISHKIVSLEKQEKNLYKKQEKIQKKELTVKEKIAKLQNISTHYLTISFEDIEFYFDIKGENLVLSTSFGDNIGNFPIVLKNDIDIKGIYPSKDKFLLSFSDKKFIISTKEGVLYNFNFKIPIKYFKEDKYNFSILTSKGLFLYNKKSQNISFCSIFSDFILYKKSYLSIIKKDDYLRLKKFNINVKNKDIIFFYNPITKKGSVIYEANFSIEKIFFNGKKIFLESGNSEIFELKNF